MPCRLTEERSITSSRDPKLEGFCVNAVESVVVVIISLVTEMLGDVDWKRKDVPFCIA